MDLSLFLFLALSYSPLLIVPRRPSPPSERVSLFQIDLVVLRVHQDNSRLALCLFQENAARSGGGDGSRAVARKGGVSSGTYCAGRCCVYVLTISRFEEQKSSPLRPRDTLRIKCKKRIVKTLRIVDPQLKNLSGSPLPPLLSSPVSHTKLYHCRARCC